MNEHDRDRALAICRQIAKLNKELAAICGYVPPDPRVVERRYKDVTGENTKEFMDIQEPLNELSRNAYVREKEVE